VKKILISFSGRIKEEEITTNQHYISYGIIRDYDKEVVRLFKSAEKYNLDGCWGYTADWLMNLPWSENTLKVLSRPSYGWAFKSICVYDALSMVDEGDQVLWVDSNDILTNDPQILFDFSQEHGIYSHDHTPGFHATKFWTHRDMFINMGCDEEKYWEIPQLQVNIMAFCKSPRVMEFVGEWVNHSTTYETMIQNIQPNLMGFREHRHEQSVFTILMTKYNIPTTKGYPYMVAHEEMGINLEV